MDIFQPGIIIMNASRGRANACVCARALHCASDIMPLIQFPLIMLLLETDTVLNINRGSYVAKDRTMIVRAAIEIHRAYIRH